VAVVERKQSQVEMVGLVAAQAEEILRALMELVSLGRGIMEAMKFMAHQIIQEEAVEGQAP
jgi:hypothetical protein